jgi:hypothetical protein
VHVKGAVVVLTAVMFEVIGLAWALNCEDWLVSPSHTPWDGHAVGEKLTSWDGLEIILKPPYDPTRHVVDHLPMTMPRRV